MFSIADGRTKLYQWDLNIQLLVSAPGEVTEAHFSNRFSKKALTVEVKKVNGRCYVEVPNILLQKAETIIVYAYYTDSNSSYTKVQESFEVTPRPKPDEYAYTETEVKNFDDLKERIEKIEQSGGASEEQIANAVGNYFVKNPITESDPTVPSWAKQATKPSYTAAEVGALSTSDVDTELSATSANPIQNKVIAAKIKELEEAVPEIAVDDELSEDSINPVQNKVIAAKIKELEEAVPEVDVPTKVSELENDINLTSVQIVRW